MHLIWRVTAAAAAKSLELRLTLPATLWTVSRQAALSMGFSRQEYWSGFPCPSPGESSPSRIESTPLTSPALTGRFFITVTTWEAPWRDKWRSNN